MVNRFFNLYFLCGAIFVSQFFQEAKGGVVVHSPFRSSPSATDLFDVSNGSAVISNSEVQSWTDPRSAFGFIRGSGIEPGNVYFSESKPVGSIDFITIQTSQVITVSEVSMFTYDDTYPGGAGAVRGMSTFSIYSSMDGVAFRHIGVYGIDMNYTTTYGASGIQLQIKFHPVRAKYFRFETARSSIFGQRIVEIDGIHNVPEPSSLICHFSLSVMFLGSNRKSVRLFRTLNGSKKSTHLRIRYRSLFFGYSGNVVGETQRT